MTEEPSKSLLRQALVGSITTRLTALSQLGRNPSGIPPSFLSLLIIRLSTTPTPVISAVVSLISTTSDENLPTILKRLRALTSATRKVPHSTRELLALVRAATLLALHDKFSEPATALLIASLASLQSSSAISHVHKRSKQKALHAAYSTVARHHVAHIPFITDILLKTAEAYTKDVHDAVAALGLLATALDQLDDSARDRATVSLATVCIKGSVTVAEMVTHVAAPIVEKAREEVLRSKVLPLVERALLREPEVALPATASLLSVLTVEVDPAAAKNLFSAVVQAVKSTDASLREHAVRLAYALGRCVGNDSAVDGVRLLEAFLKTARYSYQKVTTVEAIAVLACARGGVTVETAIRGIVKWVSAKESNEEARRAAIRALVMLVCRARRDGGVEEKAKESILFFGEVLKGKTATSDRHSLLLALTEDIPSSVLAPEMMGNKGESIIAVQNILTAASKRRHEDCLRAFAVLVTWADVEDCDSMGVEDSELRKAIGDAVSSPVLQEPEVFSSLSEVRCVLSCCGWMVRSCHSARELALATVYKLCVDGRSEISYAALKQVRQLRETGTESLWAKMFTVLWNSQFTGVGSIKVARSYVYDDGMISAEKLGAALLTTVLPSVPIDILPLVLLAANHPRLRKEYVTGRDVPQSRYWLIIKKMLPEVEVNISGEDLGDWLEACLKVIFGESGLKSNHPHVTSAAINSLGALADRRNDYSNRVLRRAATYLHPLALGGPNLGEDAHEALRLVHEADELAAAREAVVGKGSIQKKPGKRHQGNPSNPRLNQQKQAEADKARAAAASASAAAEKADAVRDLATEATNAIQLSRKALNAIHVLALVAPEGVHNQTATMLSLVLPSARLSVLEDACRNALSTLTLACSKRLQPFRVEIGVSLYGLERGFSVQGNNSYIIGRLKDLIPPALEAEDFSLVSPILRAGLLCDPSADDGGFAVWRRGSTKRRDAIAIVKAAVQVLLEHCKPEAIDSAIAAANSRAGSWIVKVLEREDGAFAAAADALALLAGTALTPGTNQLSQVLEGIASGKSSVRDAALAALARVPQLSEATIECPRDPVLGRSLWLARFDPDEANAELADELWIKYNHLLFVPEDAPSLLGLLAHAEPDIRVMSAKAIAACLCGRENEATRNVCIPQMFTLYLKKMPHSETEEDSGSRTGVSPSIKRGRERSKGKHVEVTDDGWPAREGVGLAIENLAKVKALKAKDITVCFAFLSGRALGDSNDKVRAQMSKAATAVVQAAGTLGPSVLLPMIEKQLNINVTSAATTDEILHTDRTKENLVMCLGAVAGFLPPDDERITKIADQVMKTAVKTPSEVVQNAAARCLVPLAGPSINADREAELTGTLIKTVWSDSAGYGQRRGAAYTLAGISEGRGLKYMKRSKIMEQITNAVGEKSPRRRQGAFLLVETHAILMGRKFEPFAVAAVPFLLSCMGDSAVEVRNACWAAAQAAMSEISSQGVKMILPSLLTGLNDRQWRTKAGSAEVLGAMAFCAPRQLSQCLPQVVPKLADSLADAHPRVVSSAESAINRIAAVVRSPEVRKLSPFLLAALRDPGGKTRGAIDAMLGSEFVHAIDAASLALLIPPLYRGLRDRSSELKKRSAAIVGSMCNNVAHHSDVMPYLDLLLPALRVTLLDAIPDVRRTSARALGALAVSLGEKGLPDIVPWLINALLGGVEKSTAIVTDRVKVGPVVTSSSAERSGAAMGLAEVAASMNDRRLEDILNRILAAGEASAEAREGGLMLISSMPRALGERFETKLGTALSATLRGLADDADSVREAALEAGRSLVSAYAKTSLEHLLPEILSAMRDKLWRIRLAATRLLGDMLLVIAGARPDRPDIYGTTTSAGNDVELKENDEKDDDEDGEKESGDSNEDVDEEFESPEQAAAAMSTEATMKAIEEVLGFDRRNEVLAALYIIRCDVSVRVRQTGMQVWKSVVANTPRVLREIMPSAVRQVVDGLGDEDEERRAAAGRTLGDLSQKLGDRVVPEVLPALQIGLSKVSSERVRRGACEGLGELVLASPKQQLEEHSSDLIATVYTGLCDNHHSVRAVAAEVFSYLLKPLGATAVNIIVPQLIQKLSADNDDAEISLDALREILRASGPRLMTIVVPNLLEERPLKTAAARALATAALVSNASFESHVLEVADAIIESIEDDEDSEFPEPLEDILAAIGGCGEESVKTLLDSIFTKFNEGYSDRRVAASRTCAAFCRKAGTEELSRVSGTLLEVLIRQLADVDEKAAKAALEALKDLSNALPSRALSIHIPVIRQSLRAASSGITVADGVGQIQGLQLPKAPGPFVPILTDGLLNGEPELREQAALGIGELVELTNAKSLGPFIIKLTGPLIRVMSDRFPWQVKAAVLRALLLLLKTGPAMLRTFAPQLQSTFVKSLSDKNRLVRKRACAALGGLVPIQARLEGLLSDLLNLGINGDWQGTRAAAFHSCCQVFRFGKKLPEACFTTMPRRLAAGLSDDDDEVRRAAARAMGLLAGRVEDHEQYSSLIELMLERLETEDAEHTDRVGTLNALGAIYAAGKDVQGISYGHIQRSVEQVEEMIESTIPGVQNAACATAANLVILMIEGIAEGGIEERKREIVRKLAGRAEFDSSGEVRVAALEALKQIVLVDDIVMEVAACALVVCGAETNTGIRNAADRVMRKALLEGRELTVRERMVKLMKDGLDDDEDWRFVNRRIPKLRTLPESDDECGE